MLPLTGYVHVFVKHVLIAMEDVGLVEECGRWLSGSDRRLSRSAIPVGGFVMIRPRDSRYGNAMVGLRSTSHYEELCTCSWPLGCLQESPSLL